MQQLKIGSNVSLHPMCYVEGYGGLTIGSDVSIAHSTTIMTTEHDFSDTHQLIKDTPVLTDSVSIGHNVWIGAGVRILAGVTIGNNVVIGAGSVVTKDIPSNALAVGVPAQVIKRIGID